MPTLRTRTYAAVRQIETAAHKAAAAAKKEGKSEKTFARKLCEVYSRGTLGVEEFAQLSDCTGHGQQYIMYLREVRSGEKVSVAFVAVDTATGDVVYDAFEDNVGRSKLESRLSHLGPVEIVMTESVSKATEQMIALVRTRAPKGSVAFRLERRQDAPTNPHDALRLVQAFYNKESKIEPPKLEIADEVPKRIHSLQCNVSRTGACRRINAVAGKRRAQRQRGPKQRGRAPHAAGSGDLLPRDCDRGAPRVRAARRSPSHFELLALYLGAAHAP